LPHLLLSDYQDEAGKDMAQRARIASWRLFLAGPASAPAMRGALNHLVSAQHVRIAATLDEALADPHVQLFDIDTAAGVAILAWRGDSMDLCIRTLDGMIESCQNRIWALMDIPEQLWEDLANLLTSPIAEIASR